ncbi:MAG: nitroreductase family protein [Bacillota bacterium]|nr:nitroreductase family protein [Bacillota bacterium]
MDLFDILEKRASVRSFRDDPLTGEQVATLLHAAERAPTAGNLQDYSIVLVTCLDLKAKLAELCWKQPFIKKAPLFMIFNIDQHRSSLWIERSGGRKVFDGPTGFARSFMDIGIASENVVLAAESLGLGSVYIAIVAGAARSIRQLLGYPPLVVPVLGLCVGWPDKRPQPKPRLPLRAIVHRDRYQDFSGEEIDRIYGARESAWKQANPQGLTLPDGRIVKSLSQWTTLGHYGGDIVAQWDEEFVEAIREAGFRFE